MADEQPADDSETPAEAPPPKSKNTLMIALIAGGLIAGAAAGAFAVGPVFAKKAVAAASVEGKGDAKEKEGEKKAEGKEGADVAVHMLDNLVLNPAGSGGTRFLLASVGVRLTGAPAEDEMKKREIEVRDVVLRVLGLRSVEELAEVSNRDAIKKQLVVTIDSVFGKKVVTGIYFSQFVIQ
jgi:flagellar FliL protein